MTPHFDCGIVGSTPTFSAIFQFSCYLSQMRLVTAFFVLPSEDGYFLSRHLSGIGFYFLS